MSIVTVPGGAIEGFHASILPPDLDHAGAAAMLHERVRHLGWSGNDIVNRYRQALPEHSSQGIWRAVAGDLVFQNPATRFARLHSRHCPVWKYLYGPDAADEMGAPHGAEMGAVWYRAGMDLSDQPERQRIADTEFAGQVHAVWCAFIADPRPGLDWPSFNETDADVLRIGDGRAAAGQDPFAARLQLWQMP